MSFAILGASPGRARVPGAGKLWSGVSVRITMYPLPGLFGSVNGPVKDAPAARVITSPGWAASIACCRSPPAATATVLPVAAGSVVSTYRCGSACLMSGSGDTGSVHRPPCGAPPPEADDADEAELVAPPAPPGPLD